MPGPRDHSPGAGGGRSTGAGRGGGMSTGAGGGLSSGADEGLSTGAGGGLPLVLAAAFLQVPESFGRLVVRRTK